MMTDQTYRWRIGLGVLASLLAGYTLTWAQSCPVSTSASWRQMTQRICEAMGVPGALALAVLQQESAGHPYALRINAGPGYSLYPVTRSEAVHLVQAVAPVTTNIDVGLMQVNLRIWGPKLGLSAAQLLEPKINVAAGCYILRQAMATRGPAWQRLGRYHSGRRSRQRHYARQIMQQMEAMMNTR